MDVRQWTWLLALVARRIASALVRRQQPLVWPYTGAEGAPRHQRVVELLMPEQSATLAAVYTTLRPLADRVAQWLRPVEAMPTMPQGTLGQRLLGQLCATKPALALGWPALAKVLAAVEHEQSLACLVLSVRPLGHAAPTETWPTHARRMWFPETGDADDDTHAELVLVTAAFEFLGSTHVPDTPALVLVFAALCTPASYAATGAGRRPRRPRSVATTAAPAMPLATEAAASPGPDPGVRHWVRTREARVATTAATTEGVPPAAAAAPDTAKPAGGRIAALEAKLHDPHGDAVLPPPLEAHGVRYLLATLTTATAYTALTQQSDAALRRLGVGSFLLPPIVPEGEQPPPQPPDLGPD